MNNFDSLTLKYFYKENYNFINGAIVQKIQLPSRYEVIFSMRNLSDDKPQNKKLYISINPKYPHVCFIDENSSKMRNIEIPQKPPMFCMQLRKYLNGSKIKDFRLIKYERILELYFDYFDEIGSLTRLCLALEFMGKHSNIILYNAASKIIIGSIHNISAQKSSVREIYGGINYIYPPSKNKLDILNISYSTFFEIAKEKDIKEISDNFYYFSQPILSKIFSDNEKIENVFEKLQQLQNLENPEFICNFWSNKKTVSECVDDYFSKIMFDEILKNQKTRLKTCLKNEYKKNEKIISKIPNDKKATEFKTYGDYIMSYMYSINKGQKELIVDNLKIELDENLTPNENAQNYYQKYKKEKATFEYSFERYKAAKEKNEYLDTIIFNIDNSSNFDEIKEIEQELIDIEIIKNKNADKKTTINIQKINFEGYEIYIGKNNKQNDYLISKIAKDEDVWFHGLNYPSAHVVLKIEKNKKEPTREVLEFCAKLTKENSKAKDGGKTSIIMTKRKNLRKPPNTYLGYVTYKNETEIVI